MLCITLSKKLYPVAWLSARTAGVRFTGCESRQRLRSEQYVLYLTSAWLAEKVFLPPHLTNIDSPNSMEER